VAAPQDILAQRSGGVLRLTFNRPDAMNAYSPRMVEELEQALAAGRDDPTLKVVVLAGQGRAYCCGADLKFLYETRRDLPRIGAFLRRLNALLSSLRRLPQIVVAEVNGLALGGGLETILACDLAVAAAGAVLSDQHINRDFMPGGGSSQRLPRLLGARRALDLLLTGRRLDAAEALALGILNRVVPDQALRAEVDAMATAMAGHSAAVLAGMKRLVHQGLETDLDSGIELEMAAFMAHAASADYVAGLESFLRPEPKKAG
jgi:enoyl-CoA hydratase